MDFPRGNGYGIWVGKIAGMMCADFFVREWSVQILYGGETIANTPVFCMTENRSAVVVSDYPTFTQKSESNAETVYK